MCGSNMIKEEKNGFEGLRNAHFGQGRFLVCVSKAKMTIMKICSEGDFQTSIGNNNNNNNGKTKDLYHLRLRLSVIF